MEECSYFVGNVLVQVRYVFSPDYHLVLSLLKLRGVEVFWKKKKKNGPNRRNLLNSSIESIDISFILLKCRPLYVVTG